MSTADSLSLIAMNGLIGTGVGALSLCMAEYCCHLKPCGEETVLERLTPILTPSRNAA